MDVKQQVFAELSEAAPNVLAEHVLALGRRDGRDVGLHFFNPVADAARGARSPRPPTMRPSSAWALTTKLRKRGVVVRDTPGFVVNRVLTRMTSVLMEALEHGAAVEQTDEAVLRLGLPMAPSVMLAMVGPQVAAHVLETMHDAYSDRFPLSPPAASRAEKSLRSSSSDLGASRRSPRPCSKRWPTRSATCCRRRRGGSGRHRHVHAPRRGLPVLPGRDREAPGSDRCLGAGAGPRSQRPERRCSAEPLASARWLETTGASASSCTRKVRPSSCSPAWTSTWAPRPVSSRELEARRLAVSRDAGRLRLLLVRPRGRASATCRRGSAREEGVAPHSRHRALACGRGPLERQPAGPNVEEEVLSAAMPRGRSVSNATRWPRPRELAERLEREGYGVVRTFSYVVAGTATREEARELARRVHGQAEPEASSSGKLRQAHSPSSAASATTHRKNRLCFR